MKKVRRVVLLLVVVLLVALPVGLYSYNESSTHPALTYEIAMLFNLSYPDLALSKEQIEWLIKGSRDEDIPPRWVNHFYNPITASPWLSENFGIIPSAIGSWLARIILTDYPPVTAKYWAELPLIQSQYKRFGGNQTWQKAIYEWSVKGDKNNSMYALGHILHLIEDMTVPDHTRGDTHARPLYLLTQDFGSPYELFCKQFFYNINGTNLKNNAKELFKLGFRPIVLSSLPKYFDVISRYSNRYFFSKDTIDNKQFIEPKIIYFDDNYGYGIDPENSSRFFPIVRRRLVRGSDFNLKAVFSLDDQIGDKEILQGYFGRLSKEAIIYGAGVIKLFFDEVNKEKISEQPVEKEGVFSVLSEAVSMKNKVIEFAESVNKKAEEILFITSTQKLVLGEKISSVDTTTSSDTAQVHLQPAESVRVYPIYYGGAGSVVTEPGILVIDNVSESSNVSSTTMTAITSTLDESIVINVTTTEIGDVDVSTSTVTTSTEVVVIQVTTTIDVVQLPTLVINEIAWAGTSADFTSHEWIELYNTKDEPVDISNWKISYGQNNIFIKSLNQPIIQPHEFAVLEYKKEEVVRDITANIIYESALLNDNGDVITLYDNNNDIVDKVDFSSGWPNYVNHNYRTLERISVSASSSDPNNWRSNEGFRMTGKSYGGGVVYGSPKQPNTGSIALNYKQEEKERILTKKNNPYYLGFYEIPAGYKLTVESGVIIKSYFPGAKMDIYGEININGTEEQVVLTSGNATSTSKDWQGLWFHPGGRGDLNSFILEYAGYPFRVNNYLYTGYVSQGIRAESSIVNINHGLFLECGDAALRSEYSTTTINNTKFIRGLTAVDAWYGTVNLFNSQFESFSHNNGPLQFYHTWPELGGLTLKDNLIDGPYVESSELYVSSTIKSSWPYYLNNITVHPTAELTISPGANIFMSKYSQLNILGDVLMPGEKDSPIRISPRLLSEPWGALRFISGGTGKMKNVILAGGNNNYPLPREVNGMIVVNNSKVDISDCSLLDADFDGNSVYVSSSLFVMQDCLIGQSINHNRDIIGIQLGQGSINISNVSFQNLRYGIRGNQSILSPSVIVKSMTPENFLSVEYPYQAVELVDADQ